MEESLLSWIREVPRVRWTSSTGLVAGRDLKDRVGSGKQRVLSEDIVQLRSEEGAVVDILPTKPDPILAKNLLDLLPRDSLSAFI